MVIYMHYTDLKWILQRKRKEKAHFVLKIPSKNRVGVGVDWTTIVSFPRLHGKASWGSVRRGSVFILKNATYFPANRAQAHFYTVLMCAFSLVSANADALVPPLQAAV